jgi:hypothetical protein
MVVKLAPAIADALVQARMVTISGGDSGAPEATTNNMMQVIQTVLAAQMVAKGGLLDSSSERASGGTPLASEAKLPSSAPTAPVVKR